MNKRIGFACKWIDRLDQVNGVGAKDDAKQYNLGGTTVAWLKRQTAQQAEDKLWELMTHNIAATQRLVERVGELDAPLPSFLSRPQHSPSLANSSGHFV